jgi:threonine dehydrogenase-like Zn-dependent dehydrogenase
MPRRVRGVIGVDHEYHASRPVQGRKRRLDEGGRISCGGATSPSLVELVRAGVVTPSKVISLIGELQGATDDYQAFDQRREGWHKVVLDPTARG